MVDQGQLGDYIGRWVLVARFRLKFHLRTCRSVSLTSQFAQPATSDFRGNSDYSSLPPVIGLRYSRSISRETFPNHSSRRISFVSSLEGTVVLSMICLLIIFCPRSAETNISILVINPSRQQQSSASHHTFLSYSSRPIWLTPIEAVN